MLLHGHGDDPRAQLARAHRLDPDHRLSWLVPTGPTATPHGPAWFPNGPRDEGPPLVEALAALGECIDRTSLGLGADADRSVVFGYSQGAATALALTAQTGAPWRPAGTVAVASWLANEPDLGWDLPSAAGTAFLLAHGIDDEAVPFPLGRGAARALDRAGVAVDWLEHDGGHEVPPSVVDHARAWLDRVARGERPSSPPA